MVTKIPFLFASQNNPQFPFLTKGAGAEKGWVLAGARTSVMKTQLHRSWTATPTIEQWRLESASSNPANLQRHWRLLTASPLNTETTRHLVLQHYPPCSHLFSFTKCWDLAVYCDTCHFNSTSSSQFSRCTPLPVRCHLHLWRKSCGQLADRPESQWHPAWLAWYASDFRIPQY